MHKCIGYLCAVYYERNNADLLKKGGKRLEQQVIRVEGKSMVLVTGLW